MQRDIGVYVCQYRFQLLADDEAFVWSGHVASPSIEGKELLSNLVYGIQAAFSVDCSSSCLPFLKMTLLTTKVNKLNP